MFVHIIIQCFDVSHTQWLRSLAKLPFFFESKHGFASLSSKRACLLLHTLKDLYSRIHCKVCQVLMCCDKNPLAFLMGWTILKIPILLVSYLLHSQSITVLYFFCPFFLPVIKLGAYQAERAGQLIYSHQL